MIRISKTALHIYCNAVFEKFAKRKTAYNILIKISPFLTCFPYRRSPSA